MPPQLLSPPGDHFSSHSLEGQLADVHCLQSTYQPPTSRARMPPFLSSDNYYVDNQARTITALADTSQSALHAHGLTITPGQIRPIKTRPSNGRTSPRNNKPMRTTIPVTGTNTQNKGRARRQCTLSCRHKPMCPLGRPCSLCRTPVYREPAYTWTRPQPGHQ